MEHQMSYTMCDMIWDRIDSMKKSMEEAHEDDRWEYKVRIDDLELLLERSGEIDDREAAQALLCYGAPTIQPLGEILEELRETAFGMLSEDDRNWILESDVNRWERMAKTDLTISADGPAFTEEDKAREVLPYPKSMREEAERKYDEIVREAEEKTVKSIAAQMMILAAKNPELKEAIIKGMGLAIESLRDQERVPQEPDAADDLDIRFAESRAAEGKTHGRTVSLEEIKQFAEETWGDPDREVVASHPDVAVTNPWMDERGRFQLTDEQAVETWGLETVMDYCEKAADRILELEQEQMQGLGQE